MLGIFNKLVASPTTDEQGFYVLNTVIENLEYGVVQPYMVHIWSALFTRLQNKRTVKFVKSVDFYVTLFGQAWSWKPCSYNEHGSARYIFDDFGAALDS